METTLGYLTLEINHAFIVYWIQKYCNLMIKIITNAYNFLLNLWQDPRVPNALLINVINCR